MRSYKILFSPFESVSKLLLISEEAMLGFLFQGGFETGGFFKKKKINIFFIVFKYNTTY